MALSFVVMTMAVSFVLESTTSALPWPVLERLTPSSRLHPRACEVARGVSDLRALEEAFGDHGLPLASGSMVDVFLGETIQFDGTGAYVLVLDALRSVEIRTGDIVEVRDRHPHIFEWRGEPQEELLAYAEEPRHAGASLLYACGHILDANGSWVPFELHEGDVARIARIRESLRGERALTHVSSRVGSASLTFP